MQFASTQPAVFCLQQPAFPLRLFTLLCCHPRAALLPPLPCSADTLALLPSSRCAIATLTLPRGQPAGESKVRPLHAVCSGVAFPHPESTKIIVYAHANRDDIWRTHALLEALRDELGVTFITGSLSFSLLDTLSLALCLYHWLSATGVVSITVSLFLSLHLGLFLTASVTVSLCRFTSLPHPFTDSLAPAALSSL